MSEQSQETDTSTPGIGATSGTVGEACANCDTPVDEYEWHPIRGREADDGEFRLYSFCSEECAGAWETS